MALGKHIREQRLKRNWTLEDLSEKSGVEVGTLSALEVRDSQRSKFATAIARAFGMTLEQLETGAASGKVVHHRVESPTPPYGWPLTGITPAEWHALSDLDRGEALGFIKALIVRRKRRAA